jgi:hypothetical protein
MALSAKEIEQNLGNAKLAHKLIMANGGSITIDGKKFTSGTAAFNYVKTKDISKLVVETKTPTPTPQPGGQPAQIISKSGQGSMEEIYGYIAGAFDIGELTDEATTLLAIVFAESDGLNKYNQVILLQTKISLIDLVWQNLLLVYFKLMQMFIWVK